MPTEADLDAKLAELKQAIAGTAQRVLDKLEKLSANNPDLTDEIADVTSDIESLRNIAPADTPPVETTPTPGPENPPA